MTGESMKTIHMGRRSSAVAATFAIAGMLVTPMAFADDTGTPSPPPSSGSVASGASTEDPTATETTTSTVTSPATTTTTSSPTSSTTTTTTGTATPTTATPTLTTTPPVGSPVVLRVGATGWAVKDLQSRLLVLGRASGTIDGIYDSGVATALGSFLGASSLPGDGTTLTAQARDLLNARTASATVIPRGSTGDRVKDLQVRLRLVKAAYWTASIDGWYGWTVSQRVLTFQRDQNLPQSGVVDQRTWNRLVGLTATPIAIASTATGGTVKELQLRLRAKGLWTSSISGTYSWTLGQKVLAFQRVQNLPQSGVVDRRTWSRLVAVTYTPGTFDRYRYEAGLRPLLPTLASLDYRCRTGRVMCIDKGTRTLTWVVYGKPTSVMWARFGGPGLETREGTFKVLRRYEYVVSNLYFTPMPYSMFFSGGQAVHYSSNFARIGYAGTSHGCVNIADHAQVKALYFASRIGDKVVVHK